MSRTLLAARVQTVVFDPTDYGTFAWWLRGDDVTSSAGNVSSWNDKSGNVRHWILGDANPPVLSVASLGGRDGLAFDGTNKFLDGPDLAAIGLTACEAYFVVKATNDPGLAGVEGAILGRFGSYVEIYPNTGGSIYARFGTDGAVDDVVDPVLSLAAPRVYGLVTTASEYTIFLDGTQIFTTGTNTVAWTTTPQIGGSSWAGIYFSGTIWEHGAYTAKLSAPNRAALVAGLKSYYGGW